MPGFELERVENLLRERSAEMTRTRAMAQPHPNPTGPASGQPRPEPPHVEISLEGICTECGDRISAARLRALPGALRCVGCQREFESRSG